MTHPHPASLTLTVAPWGGDYDRVETYGNLVSYFGPTPGGEVTLTAWVKRPIPPLHVTLDMSRAAPHNPHVSLDMASGNTIKNAHCYWNNGAPRWDEGALDDDKKKWLAALNTAYPGQVVAILQEAVNQINTGVAPVYVPPVAAAAQSPTFSDADFPALPGQPKPPVAQPVQSEPVPSEPVQSEPVQSEPVQSEPIAAAVETTVGSPAQQEEYDPNAPSANDEVYVPPDGGGGNWGAVGSGWDANAPSADDPVYDPTQGQASWGAVGEAVPATAYLDESVGGEGEEVWYNFAVSDGRSLGIAKGDLEAAIAGQLPADSSGPWVNLQWGQAWVSLPESIFEQTQ